VPLLAPPRLDDRTFAQLRDELIRRIPVHSREWTDHNATDPGIVLVELFAWLADNLLYRLNRAPEKAQLEFLRLLNLPPRPAAVASTMVTFSLPPQNPDTPVLVPFGGIEPRVVVSAPGEIDFQVTGEVAVLPVECRAFIKAAGPEWDTFEDEDAKQDVAQLLADHLTSTSGEPLRLYRVMPLSPPEGGALPPVTAVADSIDRSLWIALLAPEAAVRGLQGDALTAALGRLRQAISGRVLSLGVLVDDELCGHTDHHRCPDVGGEDIRFPVTWQVATGRFRGNEARVDQARYDRLRTFEDRTAALTRSGVVRLELPERDPGGQPTFGTWSADQFDPPDAGLLGVGDLPPRLDDAADEARVLTWLRVFRVRSEHPDPRLRFIDANMVSVEQAVTAGGELLGYGNGRTGQVVSLSRSPVLAESVVIQVQEGGAWMEWRRIDDLALSLPNDPHYELDPITGEVRFGDGIIGRMPLPGEMIRCLTYRYGGGARGNVAAGAVRRINTSGPAGGLRVTNPFAAAGGRDADTVETARRRIPEALRHGERAVASQDFRDLAGETPGVAIGRVEVLPRHKPHERVDEVPGVVTLIVLPAYDPLHPDEPTPDRDMLRRVCAHLEPRRLVTTELYVTPPEYVPVWVSVAVEVEAGYGIETVRRWVELAIRQYLAPLPPYGPGGQGWPLARPVRAPDVEAAVLRVEGVRIANEVLVAGPADIRPGGVAMPSGTVPMEKWQLPVMRNVRVAEGATAEPINPLGQAPDRPPSQGEPPIGVSVPVEEEEC